jgi:hypothetical protein
MSRDAAINSIDRRLGVVAREPMLHSRIYRRVAFTALRDQRHPHDDPGLPPDLRRCLT